MLAMIRISTTHDRNGNRRCGFALYEGRDLQAFWNLGIYDIADVVPWRYHSIAYDAPEISVAPSEFKRIKTEGCRAMQK